MEKIKHSQDYIDKLALVYVEHNCDISSMTVEEYLKKFNEVSEKLYSLCKSDNRWLF